MRHWIIGILFTLGGCGSDPSIEGRGSDKDAWWEALPRPEWQALERVPSAQPWFEVYRAAPGVFAIYEPGHFEEVISYLILGERQAVLFDTGLGIGDVAALVKSLTDLDVAVVNSHTHYDHIGGNHQFDDIATLDSTFANERSKGATHEEVAFAVAEGWIAGSPPPGFDPQRYRIEPFAITRHLTDGATIDIGGRTLEVIATPGHSPDSICLFDRENRLLFTGDTFYLAPLYAHLEESSLADYTATATRLAQYTAQIDSLLPGHNVTRVDPKYLQHMNQAFGAIAQGTTAYTIADGAREYPFDGFSILTPAIEH